jgi:hypothetical protein
MKDSALLVYGRDGILKTKVSAAAIRSREDARRLAPFADLTAECQVFWKGASYHPETKRLRRRSHFSYFPHLIAGPKDPDTVRVEIDVEVAAFQKSKGESARHRKAQEVMVSALRHAIAKRRQMQWSYRDSTLEYPFKGDLLADATDAIPNLRIQTPTGNTFFVDIGIVGPVINRDKLVLGAVEIEFTHEFAIPKCLLLRSLAFPLISIDVTETDEAAIDDSWAERIIRETTTRSSDARRRNYVYLNDLVAPVFVDIPKALDHRGDIHRFQVFASDAELALLNRWMRLAAQKLLLKEPDDFYIGQRNAKSDAAKREFAHAIEICGEDALELNEKSFLLLVLKRPIDTRGPLYQLHLLFARLVSSNLSAVVGYRPNDAHHGDGGLWLTSTRPANRYDITGNWVPFMPRRVGYPMAWVLRELARLRR